MIPDKPIDPAADQIEFGIELETFIPNNCGIEVGPYHEGYSVTRGTAQLGGEERAPRYGERSALWRADHDGSIRADPGHKASEFVSPILKGNAGVQNVINFVEFARRIRAKVNSTCGCHITVGIPSITGTPSAIATTQFCRKLARFVQVHAWAIYAQTGTDRHTTHYAAPLNAEVGDLTNAMLWQETNSERQAMALKCVRGIINLRKAFPPDPNKAAVEFRAFAGTLNIHKIEHHLATAFGLCRLAHLGKFVPRFNAQFAARSFPANAPAALKLLWRTLGWTDDAPGLDHALGLCGMLHGGFARSSQVALEMAEQFERRYPQVGRTLCLPPDPAASAF